MTTPLFSIFRYTGTGAAQFLPVPPYLAQGHIKVYVNGVALSPLTWINASTVQVTAPLGQPVVVQRLTSPGERLVDYQGAVPLTESDLDLDSQQAFFLAQESRDILTDLTGLASGPLETAVGAAASANASAQAAAASVAAVGGPSGATLVGYGARTVASKLGEEVSLKDRGAVGDNTVNDGPSIRTAVQSFGLLGGTVRVPHALYRVDAAGGSAVAISDPVSLVGHGGVYTAINPAGAASTDNTVSVIPGAVDHTLQKIEGLSLHNPYTGQRTGNHGIYLDTQAPSRNLSKFTIRDVLIGQGSNVGGYGIYHLNNGTNNINGGLFGSLFQNNNIKGGVKFEGSGDSLSVLHNIITGSGIGVNASLVSGASLLEVQANNITNDGGAIRIDAGARPRIIGNNIENLAPGAAAQNNSAVVNITGANGVIYGGVIKENLISGFGTSGATTLLRMRNCRGTLVEDNVMLSGAAGLTVGVDIGTDCQSVRIGANSFNAGITTRVLDNGVGTMGVVKTATLQNSWVAFAVGTAPLKFIKSGDGLVHLCGCIKSGTTTNNTIIATLPVGFRPSEVIRAPVMVVNAGTPQLAEVSIESDGNVRINYVLSSNQLNINLTFPADELAHAASLE